MEIECIFYVGLHNIIGLAVYNCFMFLICASLIIEEREGDFAWICRIVEDLVYLMQIFSFLVFCVFSV